MMRSPAAVLLTAGILLAAFGGVSQAATTVLDPGPGTDYLSISCGGQTVNEVAHGFDAAGDPVTQVAVATTCNGSGRGSLNQYYLACWTVTFTADGAIQSKVWQATNHWVQGDPAVPCPVSSDPTALFTFTDGAGNYPETLSTGQFGTTTIAYRAVLDTTCNPIDIGAATSGAIAAPGDTACHSFTGFDGNSVAVGTVGTSGTLLPSQEILGPDGTVLCGAGTGTLDCTLTASGRHIILVNDSDGTGTGGYDLSLSCLTASCASFDYTMSNSGPITVAPGGSGTTTIGATLAAGTAESVTLAAAGLPAGATASFDVGSCSPTCYSVLTLTTSTTTPAGTYPITVTGDPLGRSTMFSLTVSAPGLCPAKTALATSATAAPTLDTLRSFRDQALARTPAGRRDIQLFYRNATEAATLMLLNPDLRTRSADLIGRFAPMLQALVAGQPVTLTTADVASIDSLLAAFATAGSPALRTDIDVVRRELRQSRRLKSLGVTVR
jgi:hypothetical protein